MEVGNGRARLPGEVVAVGAGLDRGRVGIMEHIGRRKQVVQGWKVMLLTRACRQRTAVA